MRTQLNPTHTEGFHIDTPIHPYGSEELATLESRLTRFFSREYAQQPTSPDALEPFIQCASEGPTWEVTEQLMEQHYNESETLFSNFLDRKYLAYSMAYFDETGDAAQASQLSLEEAQTQKFKRICERCNIQGDERVLNIGCGFGSFEHYLAGAISKAQHYISDGEPNPSRLYPTAGRQSRSSLCCGRAQADQCGTRSALR